MMKVIRGVVIAGLVLFAFSIGLEVLTPEAMAQAADGAAPAAGGGQAASGSPGFRQIVFGSGFVNTFIWILIFGSSFATIAFIVDGVLSTGREKLLPTHVITGAQESIDEGDLGNAMAICEQNPGPLSNILLAGFNNIGEGYDTVQDSVAAATGLETEKIMQRVNYLNLCGQIAPMLGLLGTVTGMVKAFAGLANEAGAAKAQMLALAISGALWTTVAGLLISVPALLCYTILKNQATKILLESEFKVLDLIKIFRNAEIDDDEEDEEDDLDDY
jgi:biopolymer transport protein ExbB